MKNATRQQESLSSLFQFNRVQGHSYPYLFMTSSSDEGVMRNFGRNGAKFAPRALINGMQKLNNHFPLQEKEKILVQEVWKDNQELSFEQKQTASTELMLKALAEKPKRVVHLGGGHDHIYPFLMALEASDQFEQVLIINIDAHCDTRVADHSHSGTPFRDYDINGRLPFKLIQLGIHQYANSTSTFSPLTRGQQKIIFHKLNSQEHLEALKKEIDSSLFPVNSKTALVISLDCDGLDGSAMPAVSAANSVGLSAQDVLEIIDLAGEKTAQPFFGIYEFNPVYDNCSFVGRKLIDHLIYEFLK